MDVVELTRHLVAIDSQNPGSGERAIADFIENEYCRPRGLGTRRVEVVPGRPNLVVSVDRGPGPRLGLSGHLDTKPIGDAIRQWSSDPLQLTVHDGLAYGLGTSDMKGAVAAMLVALERFATDGPSGTLTLLLTADEEQGSEAGAKAIAAGGLVDVDAVVIGEPSGVDAPWEALHLVSRGICAFEIDIRTRQGHSGLSERLGRNAVLIAADVLHAFERFQPPVAAPGAIPSQPTVNPGMLVNGGVCFGTWPGSCTVGCEVRLVPGMDRGQVQQAIDEVVRAAVGTSAEYEIRYRPGSMGWMPAVAIAPEEPVVRAAQRAAQRVLGSLLPVRAYPGGTDATYFIQAGIPAVTSLGPGWLSVAHGANEHVGLDQLTTAVDLYETLAAEFLTPGPEVD
jgi:acetylornithine deacetylase/succinyl-diaminopimelate desuccinylase-like protein